MQQEYKIDAKAVWCVYFQHVQGVYLQHVQGVYLQHLQGGYFQHVWCVYFQHVQGVYLQHVKSAKEMQKNGKTKFVESLSQGHAGIIHCSVSQLPGFARVAAFDGRSLIMNKRGASGLEICQGGLRSFLTSPLY